METWIDANIARVRRNLRWTAVFLIVAVIGSGVAAHRYLANYVQGPVVMTAAELAKVKSPDDLARYWVTLTGSKESDLGVYEETTTTRNGIETGKSNSAYYGALRIGDLDLVVRDPRPIAELDNPTLTGALDDLTSDERTSVLPLLKMDPNATAAAFKLDTNSFRQHGTILIAVAAAFVLLALGLLYKARRRAERDDHPFVQQLAAFGDAHTLLMKVDAEVPPDTKARFFVTPTFAIWTTGYGVKIIPTQDIIWSHIRTGRNPAVVHHLRSGKVVLQGATRKAGQQILSELSARAPWVFIGYDKRFVTGWAKDRANFIMAADQRRLAPAPAPAPAK